MTKKLNIDWRINILMSLLYVIGIGVGFLLRKDWLMLPLIFIVSLCILNLVDMFKQANKKTKRSQR